MAPKQYKQRVALFLAWADDPQNTGKAQDPMGINKEMESLRRVLANGYGFDIFVHRIELYSPMLAVRDKVRSFIRGYSNPDTLLLLYYGGHGSYSVHDGLLWMASSRPIPGLADSHSSFPCRYVLEDLVRASSDVLILLCCCDAVPSHPNMAINCTSDGGTTEIIAACTVGQQTTAEYAPQVISLLEKRFVSGQHTTIRHVNSDLPKGIDRFTEGIFGRGRRLPARRKFSEAAYLQLHGASPKVSIVLTPVVTTPMFAEEPRYAKSSLIAKFWRLCGHGPLDSWKAVAGEATGRIY
ncbi:hypothetical protein BKA61DRAFT_681345 [Leptodontidium sp. MPI-SDFR-AT-0119]|nr:hypothetical protein BKA61DRAFT_681345 [Leptodontidium sp. MPI-SDFR-AT-0119]